MKKGDARRGELLATAERLFYTKGYEKTSVQDILNEMGFSKGGFYHHFDSKLAVLEAICELRAQECGAQARQAADRTEGTAVDKLNAVFHDSAILTSGNSGFISLMIQVAYREDGALMREKMRSSQMDAMLPVLRDIGFAVRDLVSKGIVEISYLGRENRFYLFGGKDESSGSLIQGVTLAGALLDEVVLMPRSFVEQACARCSVTGSKIWFNCNP